MTIEAVHRYRTAGLALLAAAAMALGAAPAHALTINKVKKCKTIGAAGYYELTQDLTAPGADTCLRITANKVLLNLNGHNLIGAGGIGILIAGKNVFIDGDDASLSGFSIGIEDDGDNAIVENFGIQNSSDTALYVNGASGSTFGNLGVGNSTNHGVHLRHAAHIVLHNAGISNNGKLGLWVDQSNNGVFNNFQANSNGTAGVSLGCSADGPVGAGCVGFDSNAKVILSAGADSNGAYGYAIDQDSGSNVISGAEASQNPTDDAFDGNASCGTNLWFNQNHSTSNQLGCTNE